VIVNITVDTIPSGRSVVVDGTTHTAPYTFPCVVDTDHDLDVPTPQGAGSTRYLFNRWSDGGAQAHAITCFVDETFIAYFDTEHEVTIATSPAGLTVVVDAVPYTAPAMFWWPAGSVHALDAPSPQGSGGTRRAFFGWSDGGARTHLVTVTGPQAFTANFTTEHAITVTTSPVGLSVEVDGIATITPYTFWCADGSSRTVNATTPQLSSQIRRLFRMWSDGGGAFHSVPCTAPATFTAFYDTEYEITLDTAPGFLEVIVDGSLRTAPYTFWCAANATITVNVPTPQTAGLTRYVFQSWSDGGARSHVITCTAPATFEASFGTEHWVAVDTAPEGLRVTVDGATLVAPVGFWWPEGSSHGLDLPTAQFGNLTRFTFTAWTDAPGPARTIVVSAPARYVALFDVDFFVSLQTGPAGLQLLVDGALVTGSFTGWWANGSAHTVSAPSPQTTAPGVQFVFDAWSDGGPQVRLITVAEPIDLTAQFRTEYRLGLTSDHGTATCDVAGCWYAPGATARFSVEGIVDATPGTRYAFVSWAGDAPTDQTNGTVLMDGAKFLNAIWRTEYFLRIDTAYGTPVGEGWHPAGSRAAFSVSPAEVTVDGRRLHIVGWTGDFVGRTATGSVVMDGPRVVTAEWEEQGDWWWLFLLLLGVALLLLFLFWRRRKKDEDEATPTGTLGSRLRAGVTAIRTRIRPRRSPRAEAPPPRRTSARDAPPRRTPGRGGPRRRSRPSDGRRTPVRTRRNP
jgi:hypothetical protein